MVIWAICLRRACLCALVTEIDIAVVGVLRRKKPKECRRKYIMGTQKTGPIARKIQPARPESKPAGPEGLPVLFLPGHWTAIRLAWLAGFYVVIGIYCFVWLVF